MSTYFETPEDLDEEIFAVMHFGMVMNERMGHEKFAFEKISIIDTDDAAIADYVIKDLDYHGKPIGIIEFKRRNYTFERLQRMGGVQLGRAKYDMLRGYAARGMSALFLVKFNDCMGYMDFNKQPAVQECSMPSDRDGRTIEEAVSFIDGNQWQFLPLGDMYHGK